MEQTAGHSALGKIEKKDFSRFQGGQGDGRLVDEGGSVSGVQTMIPQPDLSFHHMKPGTPARAELMDQMRPCLQERGVNPNILMQVKRSVASVRRGNEPEDSLPFCTGEKPPLPAEFEIPGLKGDATLEDLRGVDAGPVGGTVAKPQARFRAVKISGAQATCDLMRQNAFRNIRDEVPTLVSLELDSFSRINLVLAEQFQSAKSAA